MENPSVSFIKKVDGIPIYKDPYMAEKEYIVGYKGPGIIFVPIDKWIKGLATMHSAIEKEEVDEILRKKRERNFSDIKFIVCNITNEEDMDKLIQSLYKNFK